MKNSNYLLAVILLCMGVMSSCKRESGYLDPSYVFNLKDTLKAEILPAPLYAKTPILFDMDSLYWCCSGEIDGYFAQLLNHQTGEMIFHTGRIGNGPGELLYPYPVGFDRESKILYYTDAYTHTIHPFQIQQDSIIQLKSYKDERHTYFINSFEPVSDSTFAVISMSMIPQSIKIVDFSSAVYDSIRNAPIDMNDETFMSVRGFSTTIRLTPDRSKLIATEGATPTFRIFSINNNKLDLIVQKAYFKPMPIISGGNLQAETDQWGGPVWEVVTDKYIYLLNYGMKSGDRFSHDFRERYKNAYIMIFDMKGEFVKSLIFDRRFTSFTVSSDDKILSAPVTLEDDMYIAKYKLPDF